MESCVECGDSITGVSRFKCSYCGATTCPAHHVPESHDCPEVDAATPPPLIRKHIDLGITSDPSAAKTIPGDDTDDSRPETRAILRPESYPARRRTEPMPESEQSPGGKQHRDWTPDSKSPDVTADGSIAGEETAQLHGSSEGVFRATYRRLQLCIKTPIRSLTWVVLTGLLVCGIYILLSSF